MDLDQDPDLHGFGRPASGSVLGKRIRILVHGNRPKLINIPVFLSFKRLLCLHSSLADSDPVSDAFSDPWIRDRDPEWKKSGSGSEIRVENPGSYFRQLRNSFYELKIENT